MFAVLRKIQADLLNRRLASVLVTLTILAASTLVTLTATTLNNLNAAYERSFEELNGAHLWLFFDRSLTSRSAINRIEALPGVYETTGLQISHNTRAQLGEEKIPASLRAVSEEPSGVNKLRITAGRDLTLDDELGVLVDKRLAEQFNVHPGDIIQVETAWGFKPLEVVGLAFNPTWDIYRTNQPPYLYVMEKTFRKHFPDQFAWDWSIGLRLADPESVTQTLTAAEEVTRKKSILDHTDWRSVRDAYLFGTQLNTLLLSAFGIFSLGAAAFILANSISGAVLAQFRDIGVLKALGFTGREVAWVYLGQNLVMGIAGASLGVMAGIALAPLPLESLAQALDAPPQVKIDPLLLALTWLAVLVVVAGATLWPALRGARTNTIQAITSGPELPGTAPSRLAQLALRMRMPMPVVLGAKNAFTRRGRALLTLVSLLLSVISVVFSVALTGVLDGYLRDPSMVGIIYDAWVSRQTVSDTSAWRILSAAPGVDAILSHTNAEVKTEVGHEFRIRAEEGDFDRFPFKLEAGRLINPDIRGEMMIGVGLRNWLGLEVGDTLRLTVNKKRQPVEWQIVGVYREPADNGQMAVISLDTLHAIDRLAEPDTYYLQLQSGANLDILRDYLKSKAKDDLGLAVMNQEASGLVQFRVTILALSIVLSVIALLSVLNTSVLNMREQISEVGTYKTLGMTPGQIISMVLTSGGILGVFASLLGVPLGIMLVKFTFSMLGGYFGFGSFDVQVNAATLILPILVTIAVGIAGSVIPARWAARLHVVEVLQYE